MSDQLYTEAQISLFLANGGKLFRANEQLFIVEQTGLIIGPISVENSADFLTRNSEETIHMSGENFKNQLEVESGTAGITVSNVVVVDRDTITFDIACAADGVAMGGKSLTYRTRDGLDSSEVEIKNNIVVLPHEPSISLVESPGSGFCEVGAGAAASQHNSGHSGGVSGDSFYSLSQVEAALQDGATLAGLGLTPAGQGDLKVRVGQLDGGVWTDDPDCTVVINSISETDISITLSIDPDFGIAAYTDDSRSLDLVVETYSGDLGAASPADNFARTGDNKDYVGLYAIQQDALTVKRARPESFAQVVMLDDGTLPSAGDSASIAAAVAAGTDITDGNFSFKQNESKKFYFKAQSAFAANRACLDSSAVLKNLSSSTTPGGGAMHAPDVGGSTPASGWATNGSGRQALTLLSQQEFMVELQARSDQEIGSYTFNLATDASLSNFTICTISFDVSAGEFVLSTLDIALTSPEAISLQQGAYAVSATGSGLPEGFGVAGDQNENGAEGSVEIVAHPAQYPAFELHVDDIEVSSDTDMSFTLEGRTADMQAYITGGGEAEQCLGNYDVEIDVVDANGNKQQETTSIRVLHAWPPSPGSGHGNSNGENLLRESSQDNPGWDDDLIKLRLLRLRGDHQPGGVQQVAPINGIAPSQEYGEVEIKLCYKDAGGSYHDMSDSWTAAAPPQAADLISTSDAAGTDKPSLLITSVEAERTGQFVADADGVLQREYLWTLAVRCVSEEAALLTALEAAHPNHANAYGNQFAVAIRKEDETADDGVTAWEYLDNIFEILPGNIEVDAASFEVARADSENVGASGDNFYPGGAGSAVNPGGGGASYQAVIAGNNFSHDAMNNMLQISVPGQDSAAMITQLQAAAGQGATIVVLEAGSTPGTDTEFTLDSGMLFDSPEMITAANFTDDPSSWGGQLDMYLKS